MDIIRQDPTNPEELHEYKLLSVDSPELQEKIQKTVADELERFGLRASDAHERHNDFNFVRKCRRNIDSALSKLGITAFIGLCSALAAATWKGIKEYM